MRNWRINLILFLIFIFGLAIIGRLVFIQILKQEFYTALAKGQEKIFARIQGERGEIFFQNHPFPIATNKIYQFVYASPKEIPSEEKIKTVEILSEVLDLNNDFLREKLKKDSLYELIKDDLSEKEVEVLRDLDLTGIYLGERRGRIYPYQEFASHLLGFVNKDGQGQYGVEEYWSDYLEGKKEFLEGEKNPWGFLFLPSGEEPEIRGADLILTVDYNIQYFSEKLLKKAKSLYDIERGTIIVIEPHSGKILALANWPAFNPNQYFQEKDFEIFQNEATQRIFEPGSVFKPITMAGALNEGKISPQTTYLDPGVIKIDGWPIYNYDQRIYPGQITMIEVLEKSINTGAVFAERQLGHQKFLEYIKRFGIFEKTRIDLAGEVFSQNEEFKKGYEINFATASYGQGIEMTPLQLARAFCAIANGGNLVRPYLVKTIKKNNQIIEIPPEISKNNIISPTTASKLTGMLVRVVENGFGKAAKIPGYYIAGKTGTAQISWSALGINKKGYSQKTWQSFVGFVPAFDPKFLILVKLNNPTTKTAEYSATPIFKELAKYIIDYFQIPPDYEVE